jgi:DNA-binding transcriptional ArsR family regulator
MTGDSTIRVPVNFIQKDELNTLTSEQLERAAGMLKAIAHPVRIAIVNYLDGGKKLTVTEIHELLGIEQSTTSHHLGILKDKGVLASRRDGKNTYYFMRHENLLGIIDCISKCACF